MQQLFACVHVRPLNALLNTRHTLSEHPVDVFFQTAWSTSKYPTVEDLQSTLQMNDSRGVCAVEVLHVTV